LKRTKPSGRRARSNQLYTIIGWHREGIRAGHLWFRAKSVVKKLPWRIHRLWMERSALGPLQRSQGARLIWVEPMGRISRLIRPQLRTQSSRKQNNPTIRSVFLPPNLQKVVLTLNELPQCKAISRPLRPPLSEVQEPKYLDHPTRRIHLKYTTTAAK
jgi:hypothetical protein